MAVRAASSKVKVPTQQGDMVLSVASSLEPIKRTVDRVQGALFFVVIIATTINLAVDLLYGLLDPRLKP